MLAVLVNGQYMFLVGATSVIAWISFTIAFRERKAGRAVIATVAALIAVTLFEHPRPGALAAAAFFGSDVVQVGWQLSRGQARWRLFVAACLLLLASVFVAIWGVPPVGTTGLPHAYAVGSAELVIFLALVFSFASLAEFSELYHGTFHRLVLELRPAFASVEEASTAVQDAFARAYLRWNRVRRADDPEAWVRCAALRFAARRRPIRVDTPVDEPGSDPLSPLPAALRHLPPRQREVILLHHVAELPVSVIARQLGTSEATISARLSRGARRLARRTQPGEIDSMLHDPGWHPADLATTIPVPTIDNVVREASRLRWRRTAVHVVLAGVFAEAGGHALNALTQAVVRS